MPRGDDVEARLAAVWRIESARIVATAARIVGDVGLGEDLAAQAMLTALEKWRVDGVPHNPGAWLTTTAKHKAIDVLRHRQLQQRTHDDVLEAQAQASSSSPDDDAIHGRLDDDDGQQIGDDLLRLIFVSCHPLLPIDQRLALTLRLVAGLSTDEIARAFLVAEPTIAQRIVRAKRALRDADIAFAVPDKHERRARLSSVLEVLYLVFNEGYAASRGDDWLRPELCDEALRLGRVLARLVDDVAEVHGLVALMELQASRHAARTTATGEPILLLEQQRSRWDHRRISRGLSSLAKAESLLQPGAYFRGDTPRAPSEARPATHRKADVSSASYTLQAGIAACHARARRAADTDWAQIVAYYDVLLHLTSSPVVALNRAVAVSMASGPAAALPLVDALCDLPALRHYHLLPSVRGDLLMKLGRVDDAAREFSRAADLADNAREKAFLLARVASRT